MSAPDVSALDALDTRTRKKIFERAPDTELFADAAVDMIVKSEQFSRVMQQIPLLLFRLRRTVLPGDLKIEMPDLF